MPPWRCSSAVGVNIVGFHARVVSWYVDVVPRMWKKNGAGGKEEGEALPPPCPCTASCSPVVEGKSNMHMGSC
uniref:Uncharacterized protein n=1 Tax=Triticum urartu TaxID=4572 RepID=A0A8R7PCE1_TRIUA